MCSKAKADTQNAQVANVGLHQGRLRLVYTKLRIRYCIGVVRSTVESAIPLVESSVIAIVAPVQAHNASSDGAFSERL